ncbi:MAG TPA: Ig-like domain-containing protein [Longimicrobiales bacterium]|nr:Ig-like domain-containing protein [Longimicrobiales bacterium]
MMQASHPLTRAARTAGLALALVPLLAMRPATAQTQETGTGAAAVRLVADPTAIALDVGSSMLFTVMALDADGNIVDAPIRISGSRESLRVTSNRVYALQPGEHAIIATVAGGEHGVEPPVLVIPVTVGPPPVATVELTPAPGRLYAGTTLAHSVRAYHADGSPRPDPVIHWTTSDANVATVDADGNVTAHRPGQVIIAADVDGARATVVHQVTALPATRLEIEEVPTQARTGDVIRLSARALDAGDQVVSDIVVRWEVTGPGDGEETGAVVHGNRFVANAPGTYTITAAAGSLSTTRTLTVVPRAVAGDAAPVGRVSISEHLSTGLGVFRGRNGRDYAVTSSWIGDGSVYFWDVTDPAAIRRVARVGLLGRGIRDIAVSPDARYAVVSLEGAADRLTGLAILDISQPDTPRLASTFGYGVAGDVHGVAATDYHIYAVAADRGIIVIDVENIYSPQQVASFTFPDEGVRARDIQVSNGLAVLPALSDGVAVIDVGNGQANGRSDSPAFIGTIPVGTERVDAVVPYLRQATGERYLFAVTRGDDGDGTIRVLEWTNTTSAVPVATYHVPGSAPLTIRVEGDRLYAAYGDGGVRVVDVSGELLGDLRAQGREIASFVTESPDGFVPGQAMAWHAGPVGDHVLAVDRNNGLWALRIDSPQD